MTIAQQNLDLVLSLLTDMSMADLETLLRHTKTELSYKKSLRVCKLCSAHFQRIHQAQKYCSLACVEKVMQQGKNDWWRKHGTEWRDQVRTPEQKERLQVKRSARATLKQIEGMID